jgi:hypothetical protein
MGTESRYQQLYNRPSLMEQEKHTGMNCTGRLISGSIATIKSDAYGMEIFVCHQRESKLWATTDDASRASLEQCFESFFTI